VLVRARNVEKNLSIFCGVLHAHATVALRAEVSAEHVFVWGVMLVN
jgi:hypothetical protein